MAVLVASLVIASNVRFGKEGPSTVPGTESEPSASSVPTGQRRTFPGYARDGVTREQEVGMAHRLGDALVERSFGYGGARQNDGADGRIASLDVWVTGASYSDAAAITDDITRQMRPPFDVHLVAVVASEADLMYLSDALSSGSPAGGTVPASASQYDERDVTRIRNAISGLGVVSAGYDLEDNTLVLYLPASASAVPPPLTLDGLPPIRFEAIQVIQDDIGIG
jgi:hypothetical protein